jgi:hypothetical protein
MPRIHASTLLASNQQFTNLAKCSRYKNCTNQADDLCNLLIQKDGSPPLTLFELQAWWRQTCSQRLRHAKRRRRSVRALTGSDGFEAHPEIAGPPVPPGGSVNAGPVCLIPRTGPGGVCWCVGPFLPPPTARSESSNQFTGKRSQENAGRVSDRPGSPLSG